MGGGRGSRASAPSDIRALRIDRRQWQEIVSGLSHDLRAPLSSLIALTELAERTQDPELPRRMRSAARTLLSRVDGLMDLVRVWYLDHSLLHELDPGFVAENALEWVRPQAEARGVILRRPGAQPAAARVLGEGTLLERALINLLDNAIRHSPRGAAVELEVYREAGYVCCRVTDAGPGIALVSPAPRAARCRIGSGLAFVHAVAECHGGRVEIDSTPGHGSRVGLCLPTVPD